MFQAHELDPFRHLASTVTPQLPSAAMVGAAWTQISDDPFFAEINPTAMGYRSAPRGIANSDARRGDRGQRPKAFRWRRLDERSRGSVKVVGAVSVPDIEG
jgi:hypothetical protein